MKLKHPKSGQSIEVDAEHADMYLSQGWEKPAPKKAAKKATSRPAAKKTADPKPAQS